MKTILIILFIGMAQAITFAQSRAAAGLKNCAMIYSQDDDALVSKENGQHGEEIIIESLPYFQKLTIPVYINENLKGSYTFKKHPSLLLPEFYSVVIKDTFTGENFDLKSSDSYTFQVNNDEPERFVLVISNQKTHLTAMR